MEKLSLKCGESYRNNWHDLNGSEGDGGNMAWLDLAKKIWHREECHCQDRVALLTHLLAHDQARARDKLIAAIAIGKLPKGATAKMQADK